MEDWQQYLGFVTKMFLFVIVLILMFILRLYAMHLECGELNWLHSLVQKPNRQEKILSKPWYSI